MSTETATTKPHNDAAALTARCFIKEVLPGWSDLPWTKQRDIKSAFQRLSVACDTPLETIYLTQPVIASLTDKAAKACKAVSPNNQTLLKFTLVRLDGGTWAPREVAPLSSAWQELYNRIPKEYDKYGVVRFLRYCSTAGVTPNTVMRATLDDFETHLATHDKVLKPAAIARSTVTAWNRARRTTAEWPVVRLTRGSKPRSRTLPLMAFPQSFQADVAEFQRRISCSSLVRRNGLSVVNPYTNLFDPAAKKKSQRRKPAKPATVKARTYQILQAAAALVDAGRKPEEIANLRCLVEPWANAETIADHFWERAGQKPNSNAAGVIDLLRQVAKYHCQLPDGQVDTISAWLSDLVPKRGTRMTTKNALRLAQIVTARNLPILLHLPLELMKQAEKCEDPQEAARLALYGAALEVLLVCPMRLNNLRHLRLGKNVVNLPAANNGDAYFVLGADETKNEEPLFWPIASSARKLIHTYVKKYRPTIAAEGNDYLFPGKVFDARSECGMRDAIEKPLAKMGILINPHLMRHFAVWLYLKRNPGRYEMVRRILGHRDIETTIRFYSGLEAQFAALDLDKVLTEERRATRSAARIVFARPKRRAKNEVA